MKRRKPVNIKQHISSFLSTFNEGDIIFYSMQKKKKKLSQKVSNIKKRKEKKKIKIAKKFII